ncbi:NAD(P)H-hydrate dehydratase [Thermoflavimicrobium dichotomicum]|uniref:Bifunctional NAD(P)H-hydrate repair enzyme n=1 Tax=Thermoflavimicrobium dichotomicum TaxID=46223 RepID=A0A1I3TTG2_9BACL|nr:NAD(P)H-hydrate dehydratase [Thermoflavimicrobium dichotomicum]SFJ73629.1 NAD(P)H-hydrate epimerase [Thermoflavimicrobium dichotomicum]
MYLVTAQEMRRLDHYAIDTLGIPGVVLMEHAGKAVAEKITARFPEPKTAVVLCGTGNNGGDGWVVARHLLFAGWKVYPWLIGKEEKLTPDARVFYDVCCRLNPVFTDSSNQLAQLKQHLQSAQVIVDALLGTGFKGELRQHVQDVTSLVNQHPDAWVMAVDIPTGVDADTGAVSRESIRAHQTVTFGYPKWGHYLRPGADYCGDVSVVDIGLPKEFPADLQPKARLNVPLLWEAHQKTRDPWAHKGTYGHVLIIGGTRGMLGAVVMAGAAAYRMGAGMVTIAVPDGQATALAAKVTQELVWTWPGEDVFTAESAKRFADRASRFSSVAIGPGLGRFPGEDIWLSQLLREVEVPLVLDADALNILADHPHLFAERSSAFPTILTPHPGEMARLLRCSVSEIEAARPQMAQTLADQTGMIVILKGRFTIIAFPERGQIVNTTGSPALAKAGSGDLLTGMLGSFLAQDIPVDQAVPMAVYYHGRAGEIASRSMSAHRVCYSDLLDALKSCQ